MANRIKGITIEIEGSTTGLEKSLKSVDSSISKTQSALKDVNRLLKIDPKNTELLAQKQKLVSSAVDDTKTRLKALKEASKEAAKTADNYDAWKVAYTPIQEEIGKTQDKVKTLKDKMKELESAGKVDTDEYKALGAELEEEKKKLSELKQRAKEVSDEFGNPISPEQYNAIQREIVETEQKLKGLKKEAKESSSILGSQLQVAGQKMQEVGGKVTDAGKKLMPATTAIVGVGAASVKTAADFESAMSDVAATMGTTTDDITELSDKAREMGEKTSFSATEAAQGLNILAQSGLDSKNQIAAIEPVLNLAAAGSLSLESAAAYAMGAIKGFGDECSNTSYYTDLMAKGATLANTDVNGLGEALSGSAATANSYKQSAEDVTLALLRLAEQNVTGSEATTALNRAMADLYTPTKEAKEALDELGVSAYNADGSARDINSVMDNLKGALSGMSDEQANAYKNTIFTTQGLSAFSKMTSTSKDKVNEFREGLAEASKGEGAAAEQAQTKLDNLNGQVTILKSALSEAAISIGETLIPIIKEIVAKVQEWTDKFNGLNENQKKMIIVVAGIIAALGPAIIIIGTIISAIGTIVSAIGTVLTVLNPVALIIAAIVAAGVALYMNWETVKQKAGELGDKISEGWNSIKEKTGEAWDNVKNKVGSALDGVKTSAANAASNAKTTLANGWENIRTNTLNKWNSIKNAVQQKGGGIKGVLSVAVEGYKGLWRVGFAALNTITGGKLGEALTTVNRKMSEIKTAFKDKLESAKDAVKSVINKIKDCFNFSWKLPSLKLPHISIKGSFSLNPPKVPKFSIDWYRKAYDKAMVLSGPTIFGYSEKTGRLLAGGEGNGNEIVSGEAHLMKLIEGAVTRNDAGMVSLLERLTELVQIGFPAIINNMDRDIVLDDGTIAGRFTTAVDVNMGRIETHKRRRN